MRHDLNQHQPFERKAEAQPPVVAIAPFPLARRLRKVRSTANTLNLRKSEDSKRRYWKQVTAGLAGELRRHGADEATIVRQLAAFYDAVGAELTRHLSPATGGTPRGAA